MAAVKRKQPSASNKDVEAKNVSRPQKKKKSSQKWLEAQVGDMVHVPEPEEQVPEEEEEEVAELDGEEEEEDDGEDEEEIDEIPGLPLPKSVQDKLDLINNKKEEHVDPNKSTVVYIGHLPYGFFEYQLREFLSQFGEIKNIHLSRAKTGRHRGYGFVQFRHPEVAEIVADTMNDYLIFKRRLVCKVLPLAQQQKLHFPTSSITEITPHFVSQRKFAEKYNERKPVTAADILEREKKRQAKLKSKGIDYAYSGMTEIAQEAAPQIEKAKINEKETEKLREKRQEKRKEKSDQKDKKREKRRKERTEKKDKILHKEEREEEEKKKAAAVEEDKKKEEAAKKKAEEDKQKAEEEKKKAKEAETKRIAREAEEKIKRAEEEKRIKAEKKLKEADVDAKWEERRKVKVAAKPTKKVPVKKTVLKKT